MHWQWIAGAGIGYLLGSLSPAYLLGRVLRGIDIRTVNYRNAGTRNVKKSLGLWPALVTAVIDTTKGIGAVVVVGQLFGTTGYVLLAPAAAAVAGHIFPFYLGFRGGRGTATAVGLYLYVIALGIAGGQFPWFLFVGLLVIAALVYLATRSGDATALYAFLGMIFVSGVELGFSVNGVLALAMSGYAFLHAVFRGRQVGLYGMDRREEFLGWRVIARPLALLFVPLALAMPRIWFLILLAALAAAALTLDAVRTSKKIRFARVYREKEAHSLSSISLFLISVLLMFVLFRISIASLALVYLTIGDLAGKLTGLRFGRHKLLGGRTLEGTMGFVAGSLICGYLMASAFGEPALVIMAAGAIGAAGIEQITIGIDDNLSVGLGSAGLLTLFQLI